MSEVLCQATADDDEDGFHLRLVTDDDNHDFRVTDVSTARALLSAVSKLRPWIADHDRERAAYEKATTDDDGGAFLDGQDRLLESVDLDRKARRESAYDRRQRESA